MTCVDGLYVGLLSGTSIDAIDAALLHIDDEGVELRESLAAPMPVDVKAELLRLSESETANVDAIGRLDRRLGTCFADAVMRLLDLAHVAPRDVCAIGSHGQTIRHRPPRTGEAGFSWQIGDPHTIAELTGICTVADFRRRDMAAGGQGAPLAPAFHLRAFSSDTVDRAIVNIGGMANITLLHAAGKTAHGFDTGPGNALLDAWHQRHKGSNYDHDGNWARGGRVDQALLERLLRHPYFLSPPPKSTGREEFNLDWLDAQLNQDEIPPRDVQATLAMLTVETISTAIARELPTHGEVFVCGGGAHNGLLMEWLARRLQPRRVRDTTILGVDPDWVEAALFAWLARQTLGSLPGNLPAVTGARHPAVLGSICPASNTSESGRK